MLGNKIVNTSMPITLLLFLAGLVSALDEPVKLADVNSCKILCLQVTDLMSQGECKDACALISINSRDPGKMDQQQTSDYFKKQLTLIPDSFVMTAGSEYCGASMYGESVLRINTITKYDKGFVKYDFVMYRAKEHWQFMNFSFIFNGDNDVMLNSIQDSLWKRLGDDAMEKQ